MTSHQMRCQVVVDRIFKTNDNNDNYCDYTDNLHVLLMQINDVNLIDYEFLKVLVFNR